MIFFGTNGRTAYGDSTIETGCPNCDNRQFRAFGTQRYFHLYWIPTVPIGRTVGIECTSCKHTRIGGDVPAEVRDRATQSAFAGRSILPNFTGLFLIGLLALFAGYQTRQADAQAAAYLDAPAIGDYYVVDFTKVYEEWPDKAYPFGILRLAEERDDYVTFQVSDVMYGTSSRAINDIKNGSAAGEVEADDEGFQVEVTDMADWRAAGAVVQVLRP